MTYEVIKTINGRRYRYLQRSYREGGKVRTQSTYLGPVDGGRRRKSGILAVLDDLVRKTEPVESEEQLQERIVAEDREYAERDRINDKLTTDKISLDAIAEIAASQAETTPSEAVAETSGAESESAEAAEGEAEGESDGDGDGDAGSDGSGDGE